MQFVDDTTIPYSSPGQVRDFVNKHLGSACSQHALRMKTQFHYGRSKTSVSACFDSPCLGESSLDCKVVESKTILGVLFDKNLSFEPLLSQMIAKGWSLFEEMLHAAECGGFSVPVLTSQILVRIHPVLLYSSSSITHCWHSVAGTYAWALVLF